MNAQPDSAMVDRACLAYWGEGWEEPEHEGIADARRLDARNMLEAALAAPKEAEYDRDLIADMLGEKVYDDGYGMKSQGAYTVEAIGEQIRLLRAADNRDAAGVHTACKPSGQQGASLEGDAEPTGHQPPTADIGPYPPGVRMR